ncbi:glycosyltransferase [Methanobacterium sp.]|uniref:glycosyltransferase n=1 Tax=Methanobacterium sp. TaxID=2164 RepID=UPI003159051E
MNRFWSNIIQPITMGINTNYIIEIGSDTGINTKNILKYCIKHNAYMVAIDPFPKFDVDEFKAKYGDKFKIYNELSLSRLPLLKGYDMVLIDGDHNWYTVYNELKIIEKSFKNRKFPVVFLHDVGWPYARRDLYYSPENIPAVYRQPYKKLGMYPGQTNLKEQGGLNNHLYNSIYENNPKNGILTAIEDFISESELELSFKVINAFHGLCILFPKNDEMENLIEKVIENANLLDIIEEERVKFKIAHSEEKIRVNSFKNQLNENKKELEYFEDQFNQTVSKLEQTENKLKLKDELIEEKCAKIEKAELKLVKTENKLEQIENRLNKSNKLIHKKESQLGDIKIQFNQTVDKLNLTEKKLKLSNEMANEKEKCLEEVKFRLNHAEHKLEQTESQLNKLIQEKQNFIDHVKKREKAAEELNLQIDNLKASLIEMEYLSNKSRSITQRLISKFPGLYVLFNMNETGLKNALVNIKGYRSIKKNKLVDTGYYLKNNRGVRSSGMDPILHYMYHGFKEGKKPNAAFNGDYYLKKYKDVKKSNLNPLVHYSLYGIEEGRKTDTVKEGLNSAKHKNIKGHINCPADTTLIRGWLAKIGNNNPRLALLKIDNQSFEFICSNFRLDLKGKINDGNHAFEFVVPLNFVNGKKHKIELFDKETGECIAKTEAVWHQKRHFTDFSGFLADSLVSPVINAPFREEDKRCFAVMENIAEHLTNLAFDVEENILVSVIMPVYNRARTVKSAIDSVLTQTYRNIELVIVDDGSDDGTVELIEDINDDRIVLLRNNSCQGVSKARNRALKAARGKYIAYLDSDNTWDLRYIAAMVGAFLKLPDAEAVYSGQFLFKGNSEKPFAARFGSFNRSLLLNRNYIDMNSFCHTRDIYNRLGGFDESIKRYVDWDLVIRISESAKMYSVPVMLSNYYYDLADNTITNDASLVHYHEILREKQGERLKYAYSPTLKSKAHLSKVSVIIPSYESLNDIKECIVAVLMQDNDWVDIIVVDNNSSQPVVNYLVKMADAGKIRLIQNDVNYGFTYAVNQGIAASKPDSDIIILNNDAIIMPGAVEAMQDAAYKLPQCGITVPQQVLPGETRTLNAHVPHANPEYECDVNLSKVHKNIINVPTFHSGELLELSFAPFFCVYIKRDVLNSSAGLDAERGRHYRSDRIFCNYIRHVMNLKIYHVAEAVVYHKLQKSTHVLRKESKGKDSEFDIIFRKNQWDDELAAKLGYKTPIWDF